MSFYEERALKIVQNLLKTDKNFLTEPLSGGCSGSSLIKVHVPESALVVRFWNQELAEDFPQDLTCQKVASDAGYGPRLFLADRQEYCTVIEYLHPESPPEPPLKLEKLVALLKKMHLGPEVPEGIDKADTLDEFIEKVATLNPKLMDFEALYQIKESVFAATRDDAHSVPCHRDLHPGNLIYNGHRFWAIDFTWCGMDDPFTDLVSLAIFHCKNLEDEKFLLKLYLENDPTPRDLARLALMKLPTKMFHGLSFLQLASPTILSRKNIPKPLPKSYIRFWLEEDITHQPSDFLRYGLSLLQEVLDYAQKENYAANLALFHSLAMSH